MKTNNLPDYPRITLAELTNLKLDPDSARCFERRYFPGSLGGTGLGFGGYGLGAALRHFGWITDAVWAFIVIGSFAAGTAVLIWTNHRMMRARPRSIRSGEAMEPFIIADIEAPDHYEIAYVDHASGTYFRRIYVERGG